LLVPSAGKLWFAWGWGYWLLLFHAGDGIESVVVKQVDVDDDDQEHAEKPHDGQYAKAFVDKQHARYSECQESKLENHKKHRPPPPRHGAKEQAVFFFYGQEKRSNMITNCKEKDGDDKFHKGGVQHRT
jgi:hypothetical protein